MDTQDTGSPGTPPQAAPPEQGQRDHQPEQGQQPQQAPAEQPAIVPEPVDAGTGRRARRRGRTALLIAVAAVVGIAGGTAVGYGIQAEREPTPLPVLIQAGLTYPAKPLPADARPVPLSADEDHQVKTDGDLRKLLLSKPSGARKGVSCPDNGWMNPVSYAEMYRDEGYMLEFMMESDLRRVACASWEQGEYKSTFIQLVQFRTAADANVHATGQLRYVAGEDESSDSGDPLKGSGNGRYAASKLKKEPGYLQMYRARAVFQRGNVMVDIYVFDTKRISKNEIRTLAERQLERL
ncbi:hypothetical protein V1460_02755 [Streptomyces sp. SCSIO 30461]|uniref:hypothetical protein n=1 Tax=Streptomyces sp. SCSIO 30461 TaxID=3118085 RepID=UPI0030CE69C6